MIQKHFLRVEKSSSNILETWPLKSLMAILTNVGTLRGTTQCSEYILLALRPLCPRRNHYDPDTTVQKEQHHKVLRSSICLVAFKIFFCFWITTNQKDR